MQKGERERNSRRQRQGKKYIKAYGNNRERGGGGGGGMHGAKIPSPPPPGISGVVV
jgi:hypothetical protein